ncbi:MAG: hypothetical protein QW228_06085 [Candidatus Aenigmatarchaeota archaeon]
MPKKEAKKSVQTIARTGAIVLAIMMLGFILVVLLADLLGQRGFGGETLASFFNFFSIEKDKCDCEYSSEYNSKICNPFCGDSAGALCLSRSDCLG